MKRLSLILSLVMVLFLAGCSCQTQNQTINTENPVGDNTIAEISKSDETQKTETLAKPMISCTHNSNCSETEYCLNGLCGKLAESYPTKIETCSEKCKISSVEIYTSDDETYDLALGQGSYTAAGALEWKTVSGQEFCSEDEPIVFIKVLKKNYGEIYGDEVITLKTGETSKVIIHPLMPQIKFTLTVKSLEKVCG